MAFLRHGTLRKYTLLSWLKTVVDADSAAGQKVLNVASTAGFAAGDVVEIDSSGLGGGAESKIIDTVQAGISLTMTANLDFEHTAVQADPVFRQGKYQDVAEGGVDGDDNGQVAMLGGKIVTVKAASVTDGNGFTISIYGKVNGEEVLLHQDSIVLAADNGTYPVVIGHHVDDIKAAITAWLDGTPTVKMSGKLGSA